MSASKSLTAFAVMVKSLVRPELSAVSGVRSGSAPFLSMQLPSFPAPFVEKALFLSSAPPKRLCLVLSLSCTALVKATSDHQGPGLACPAAACPFHPVNPKPSSCTSSRTFFLFPAFPTQGAVGVGCGACRWKAGCLCSVRGDHSFILSYSDASSWTLSLLGLGLRLGLGLGSEVGVGGWGCGWGWSWGWGWALGLHLDEGASSLPTLPRVWEVAETRLAGSPSGLQCRGGRRTHELFEGQAPG